MKELLLIAEALKHNSSLTILILEVSEVLFPPTHLLADNQIGAEGASSIAEALKHNSSLTDIDLGCK